MSDGVTIWEAEEVGIGNEGFCGYGVAVCGVAFMSRCEEKAVH